MADLGPSYEPFTAVSVLQHGIQVKIYCGWFFLVLPGKNTNEQVFNNGFG